LLATCAALVALVHLDKSGTHLLPVLVGMALTMGGVLVVTAAELSNAKWIKPVKLPLLATAPLLFVFPFLVKLAPYPWLAHENAWLRADFFLARDVVALLVVAVVGNLFRRASLAESATKGKWAVAYILTFAVVKTLVAMDWVMSFDYPWISTMFPVLYLVETFYAGLALLGLICFARRKSDAVLYDAATLLFGFALFWGGLFFAQYLTIWYGNIPEEAAYFTHRFALPGGTQFFTGVCVLLFGIPFGTLLIHRARKNVSVVFALAHVVLIGLLLHRVFHLLPHVSFQMGWLVAQWVAMFSAVALSVRPALEDGKS
jgi:hypothetical protein